MARWAEGAIWKDVREDLDALFPGLLDASLAAARAGRATAVCWPINLCKQLNKGMMVTMPATNHKGGPIGRPYGI